MRSSAPEGQHAPRAKQAPPSGSSGATAGPAGATPPTPHTNSSPRPQPTAAPLPHKSASQQQQANSRGAPALTAQSRISAQPRGVSSAHPQLQRSQQRSVTQQQQQQRSPPTSSPAAPPPPTGPGTKPLSSLPKAIPPRVSSQAHQQKTSPQALSKAQQQSASFGPQQGPPPKGAPSLKQGSPSAKAAPTSAAPNPPNFGEYDDQEWDVGVGHLIIDLDADIAQADRGRMSGAPPPPGAPPPNSAGPPGTPGSQQASEDKHSLKMKIKRTKPPTKTSEAKHEIVKPDAQIPPASGGVVMVTTGAAPSTPQHNGATVALKGDAVGTPRGTPVAPRTVYKKEKRRLDVNGTASSPPPPGAASRPLPHAPTPSTAPSTPSHVTMTPSHAAMLPNSNAAAPSPAPTPSATPAPANPHPHTPVKSEPPAHAPHASTPPSARLAPQTPLQQQQQQQSTTPAQFQSQPPTNNSTQSPAQHQSAPPVAPPAPSQGTNAPSQCQGQPKQTPSQNDVGSPAPKRIKLNSEGSTKRDACVGTSVATITEPDCLGPCEPGSSVTLEGIVWHETEGGVLVVNVTWRGKTYVGTLLDCTKHDWAPPRFCDSPTSDLESRTPKGRAKRGRASAASSTAAAAASAAAAAASSAAHTPITELNVTETRSGKLRNYSVKGRRGNSTPTFNPPPPSPVKGEVGAGTKRKGREGESSPLPDPKMMKRARSASRGPPTNGCGSPTPEPSQQDAPPPPASPPLIECPEPNCSKKYKHINGLKYHQSHAHNSNEDEGGNSSSSSSSIPEGRGGEGSEAEEAPRPPSPPSPTLLASTPADASSKGLVKPAVFRPSPVANPENGQVTPAQVLIQSNGGPLPQSNGPLQQQPNGGPLQQQQLAKSPQHVYVFPNNLPKQNGGLNPNQAHVRPPSAPANGPAPGGPVQAGHPATGSTPPPHTSPPKQENPPSSEPPGGVVVVTPVALSQPKSAPPMLPQSASPLIQTSVAVQMQQQQHLQQHLQKQQQQQQQPTPKPQQSLASPHALHALGPQQQQQKGPLPQGHPALVQQGSLKPATNPPPPLPHSSQPPPPSLHQQQPPLPHTTQPPLPHSTQPPLLHTTQPPLPHTTQPPSHQLPPLPHPHQLTQQPPLHPQQPHQHHPQPPPHHQPPPPHSQPPPHTQPSLHSQLPPPHHQQPPTLPQQPPSSQHQAPPPPPSTQPPLPLKSQPPNHPFHPHMPDPHAPPPRVDLKPEILNRVQGPPNSARPAPNPGPTLQDAAPSIPQGTPLSSLPGSPLATLKPKGPDAGGPDKTRPKELPNGLLKREDEAPGREDARSPAYSDISDANEGAPALDDEADSKEFKDEKKPELAGGGAPPYAYGLYFGGYAQPPPPYLMPPSIQHPQGLPLKPTDIKDLKEPKGPPDKDKKDYLPLPGGSDYMKFPPQYLYSYSHLYPPGYPDPYLREPLYKDMLDKPKLEHEDCAPLEEGDKGPTDLSRNAQPHLGPNNNNNNNLTEKGAKESGKGPEGHLSLKEAPPLPPEKRLPGDPTITYRYTSPYDPARMPVVGPPMEKGLDPKGPPSLANKPSTPIPLSSPRMGATPPSKEEKGPEKRGAELKSEGVKPTMETTGPPPPPTSSAYYPPFPYSHVPFDPYRSTMVPGMSLAAGFPPYLAASSPGLGGLRYQLGVPNGPEDLSPSGAGGTILPAGLYTGSHKIAELQERAQKSPSAQGGGVVSSGGLVLNRGGSPLTLIASNPLSAIPPHTISHIVSSPSFSSSPAIFTSSIAAQQGSLMSPGHFGDRKTPPVGPRLPPHPSLPEGYPYHLLSAQFSPHFAALGVSPTAMPTVGVGGPGVPPSGMGGAQPPPK